MKLLLGLLEFKNLEMSENAIEANVLFQTKPSHITNLSLVARRTGKETGQIDFARVNRHAKAKANGDSRLVTFKEINRMDRNRKFDHLPSNLAHAISFLFLFFSILSPRR